MTHCLANVFIPCGFIEAWGRGIEKICKECDQTGNKYPVFDISDIGFMVRFDALETALIQRSVPQGVPQGVSQGVPQGVPQALSDLQKRILEQIKNNPCISRSELAAQCGVSVKTIGRRLAEMEAYVGYVGSGYSGYWQVYSTPISGIADNKKMQFSGETGK